MPGFAHIIRLGLREGTYGRMVGDYQFTYNESGKTWVRTFDDEASLLEFLTADVAVAPHIAEKALDEVRHAGNITLADVNIPETEAPAMGLEQLPSDY